MRVSNSMIGLIITSMGTLCVGCAVDVDADGSQDETATVDQELITGIWDGQFSNGNAGPNPVIWNGIVPCEAFDSRNNSYNPGKLWNGTCRYEFGGGVVYAGGYYTLQFESGMFAIANPGFTPPNAITGSSPGDLPVCAPFNFSQSTGKVWLGRCLFEWGDRARAETGFWFLGK